MQLQLFPDPAPDSFVGLFVFSRRGRGGWGCCGGVSGAGGGGCGGEVGRNREQNV